MVEVRLTGWVGERPVGDLPGVGLDHSRKSRAPVPVACQEIRLVNVEDGMQLEAVLVGRKLDRQRRDVLGHPHTGPVVIKAVGRPSSRRRDVELAISIARAITKEGLEAGMTPELVLPGRFAGRRQVQVAEMRSQIEPKLKPACPEALNAGL